MGSLAVWGGIGGAGKGEVENVEAQRKVEASQMETDRAMALAKLAQSGENQRQQAGFSHEDTSQAQQFGHEDVSQGRALTAQKENVAAEQTGSTGRTKMEVDERQKANAARNSAMITVGAGHDAARKDAADAAAKKKNGWSTKIVKQTGFDPTSHLPIQNDKVAVTHPAYGTFIQNGDKFLPQGTEPTSVKRAPVGDVNDLLTNPDHADAFLTAHAYLPASYFKVLDGKGQLNQADEPTPSQPGNPTNDPALEGLSPSEIQWAQTPAE